MKLLLVLLVATFAFASPPSSRAQLGLTLKQCAERYGKPVRTFENKDLKNDGIAPEILKKESGSKGQIYEKDGFTIRIRFLRGLAGSISIERGVKKDVTTKENQELLDANKGTFTWNPDERNAVKDNRTFIWERTDGAKALYDFSEVSQAFETLIMSKDYIDAFYGS